jgi:U4/U6.U5 tri-snRNP-associated protein 2
LHDDIKLGRRKYRITRLPQFLVLHVKRFLNNRYFTEKNPTIVNFPVKNLELKDIIPVPRGILIPNPVPAEVPKLDRFSLLC